MDGVISEAQNNEAPYFGVFYYLKIRKIDREHKIIISKNAINNVSIAIYAIIITV